MLQKEPSEAQKQRSNKPEHMQRVIKGWVPESAAKDMWDQQAHTGPFFVFEFQGFSIYLKTKKIHSMLQRQQSGSLKTCFEAFWAFSDQSSERCDK